MMLLGPGTLSYFSMVGKVTDDIQGVFSHTMNESDVIIAKQ